MADMRTRFECSNPILNIKDMSVSLKYYVDVLGFKNADCEEDALSSRAPISQLHLDRRL
jgi:hypothetical protein